VTNRLILVSTEDTALPPVAGLSILSTDGLIAQLEHTAYSEVWIDNDPADATGLTFSGYLTGEQEWGARSQIDAVVLYGPAAANTDLATKIQAAGYNVALFNGATLQAFGEDTLLVLEPQEPVTTPSDEFPHLT
jgi:hypothetical protein